MLRAFLGDAAFAQGLNRYLNKWKFGSPITSDLWASLSSSNATQLATNMNTWMYSPGYPLLTVTPDPVSGNVTVTQERFVSLLLPTNSTAPPHPPADDPPVALPVWWVPLTYHSSVNDTTKMLPVTVEIDLGHEISKFTLLFSRLQQRSKPAPEGSLGGRATRMKLGFFE